MTNTRRIVVLLITTWAFVVCFAVWMMFGVTGIPIRESLGLNAVRERVAERLRRSVEARALRQYISVLAGQAEIVGIDLQGATSRLVQ